MNVEKISKQKEYWTIQFPDKVSFLSLPFDYPKTVTTVYTAEHLTVSVGKELSFRINEYAKKMGMDTWILLLGTFYHLLSRYTSKEDITIGLPVCISDAKNGVIDNNTFANILPLRNLPNHDKTQKSFLKDVKESILGAFENGSLPLKELQKIVGIGERGDEIRDDKLDTTPIWDVLFSIVSKEGNNGFRDHEDIISCGLEKLPVQYHLGLEVSITKDETELCLVYHKGLFKYTTIERMMQHYRNLLVESIKALDTKLTMIQMIGEEEKEQILTEFNKIEGSFTGCTDRNQRQWDNSFKDKTIHQLFEDQAGRTPQNIAVTFEDKSITYQELNERANRLAHVLRERGVKPDSMVGIMLERSIEMVVAVLGVLKAGGAIVPVDCKYPVERIKYMLEDSQAGIIITDQENINLNVSGDAVIHVKDFESYKGEAGNPIHVNHHCDMLYLIYTSGTTGKPKGVILEHKNMVNLIYHEYQCTNIAFDKKVMQFTTISFDVCYQEIFSTLLAGGELCIVNENDKTDFLGLFQFVKRQDIHVVFLPASYFKFVLKDETNIKWFPTCIKHIITAGEQLMVTEPFKEWLKKNDVYLHNHYGPSETHVATTMTLNPKDEIPTLPPIGKPVINNRIYILNKYKEIQPIGVPGELYIAGENVGRGYFNRPLLTSEKFMSDLFEDNDRMYKTGDLARWMPNGNIEFLGRLDHQVKIRGFRIELGEIEALLLKHSQVKEAVVIDRETARGDKYLCAYIVSDSNFKPVLLRDYLSREIPDYMIPSYFVQVDKIPLTPNGKVDRKSLPEPQISGQGEYAAPRNQMEETLVFMWRSYFNSENIGISDEFFHLGGDSIKAIELISKINQMYGIQLKLSEFFEAKSIEGLSGVIESKIKDGSSCLVFKSAEPGEYYPVTFVQKSMFVVKNTTYATRYNLGRVDMVAGNLDLERFENAVNALVMRHETLRTSFHMIDGEYVQKIETTVSIKVYFKECREEDARKLMTELVVPFDLKHAPLLRVHVLKVEDNQYYILIDMHHIIFDGISLDIFDEELWRFYRGETLPPLAYQYKDYAVWQDRLLKDPGVLKYESYWLNQLKGFQFTQIPIDIQHSEVIEYSQESMKVSEEDYRSIQEICSQWEITKPSFIIGIFMLLLRKETKKNDITVGLRVSNRLDNALQSIMGCFLEKVAVRSLIDESKTIKAYFKEMNTTLVDAMDHALYPFELLQKRLGEQEDMKNPELFNIIANYMIAGIEKNTLFDNELAFIKSFYIKKVFSKYDINFKIFDSLKDIELQFKYMSSRYKRHRILGIIEGYQTVIHKILSGNSLRVKDL